MAKGSFNNVLKGKLGNSVFYRLKNSNNKEKQGVRVYVADPSNPQTSQQAEQRAKLAPVVAFYRANKDLLNHSFIAIGSAGDNYRRFLKLALSGDFIPAVDKDENTNPVPGTYTISEGPLAGVVAGTPARAGGPVATTLSVGSLTIGADTTLAQLSQAIEDNNAGFVDGDELLFVAAFQLSDGSFFYSKQYIILNTQAETTLETYGTAGAALYGLNHVALSVVEGNLAFQVMQTANVAGVMEAVAVSHSRQVDGTWVYSKSVLTLSADLVSTYFSAGARTSARRSYMPSAGSNKTSDKLLQQAGGVDPVEAATVSRIFPMALSIEGYDSTLAMPALGAALSNGQYAVFVDENNVPVYAGTGQPFDPTAYTEYLSADNISFDNWTVRGELSGGRLSPAYNSIANLDVISDDISTPIASASTRLYEASVGHV